MPETNENLEPTPKGEEVNYDDLLKSDERFSSWLKSKTQKAAETAVQEAGRKWKIMHDNSMERSGALWRSMTAEEQAEYYRKK